MYDAPGMLMGLEPLNAPAAAGPRTIGAGPPQQVYSHKSSALLHPLKPQQDAPMSPRRSDLASAGAAAGAAPASPLGRRGAGAGASAGGGYTAGRPPPLALKLLIHGGSGDSSGDAELEAVDGLDDLPHLQHLPSMVPDDEELAVRTSAAAAATCRNTRRSLLGGLQGSAELPPPPGSPGGLLLMPRQRSGGSPEAAAAAGPPFSPASGGGGALRARGDLPLIPSTPSTLQPRSSLRATSVAAPHSPPLPYYCSGSAATFAAAGDGCECGGAESPQLRSSYKSQMRRLRVALGGGGGGGDGPPAEDDDDGDATRADDQPPSGRCRLLGEQCSGALGAVDEVMPPRRGGTHAWGPMADSAPGSLGSSGAKPLPAPGPASTSGIGIGYSRRAEDLPAAPHPSHSRSLAGGGGSANSTPGTAGSGGGGGGSGGSASRLPLAWQPSTSSSTGSSSIGFSRRLEDLPAAPNPANSRSLAGGRRSGGSTPSSPAPAPAPGTGTGGGVGSGGPTLLVHRAAQQLLGPQPGPQLRPAPGGAASCPAQHEQPWVGQLRPIGEPPLSPSFSTSPAVSCTAAAHPLQLPSVQSQPRPASLATRGSVASPSASGEAAYPSVAGSPSASGISVNSTGGSHHALRVSAAAATAAAGGAPSPVSPAAPPPLPRPPPQRQSSQGVGFSRRLEDLPAAPSPANSRSLAGGAAGSSASSTRSCGGPAAATGGGPPCTPPSSAAAAAPSGRRLEDLPAAPPPSLSRSLRPESSRAVFRSHAGASGAAGAAAGGGGGGFLRPSNSGVPPQAPASPVAWGATSASGGGGGAGLRASLGSPSPKPPPPLPYGAAAGLQLQQQLLLQQWPRESRQQVVDEVVDLPVVQGGLLEEDF